MMQREFNFYGTDTQITYTEAKTILDRKYTEIGAGVLEQRVVTLMGQYEKTDNPKAATRLLSELNVVTLELSVFKPEWFEFSVAILSAVSIPSTANKLVIREALQRCLAELPQAMPS